MALRQPSTGPTAMTIPNGLTYRDAGVDIDEGNLLVEKIKPAVRSTRRPGAVIRQFSVRWGTSRRGVSFSVWML